MRSVTRKLTLDFQRKSTARVVFASQADLNSRILEISLYDDGVPYVIFPGTGVSAAINVRRPDGMSSSFPADITGLGEVTYKITSWPLGVAGEAKFCVALYDKDGNRLTTAPFTVYVAEGLYLGSEVEEDKENQTAFNNMMSKFAAWEKSEQTRVSNENTRCKSESSRENSESARRTAESSRNDAEGIRNSNEKYRQDRESARGEAEAIRVANEKVRGEIIEAMITGLDNLLALQEAYINNAGGTV